MVEITRVDASRAQAADGPWLQSREEASIGARMVVVHRDTEPASRRQSHVEVSVLSWLPLRGGKLTRSIAR
jgi:hypothetical protein